MFLENFFVIINKMKESRWVLFFLIAVVISLIILFGSLEISFAETDEDKGFHSGTQLIRDVLEVLGLLTSVISWVVIVSWITGFPLK
jgi:hypothetical protein